MKDNCSSICTENTYNEVQTFTFYPIKIYTYLFYIKDFKLLYCYQENICNNANIVKKKSRNTECTKWTLLYDTRDSSNNVNNFQGYVFINVISF